MSKDVGFALRAPWYVRERGGFSLRDARSLRPEIQMYDSAQFVSRLLADPRDSLKQTQDDSWSYPVPVAFPAPGTGRERLATSRLVHTKLRKLYQPAHNRFYAVVVEVFCDEPGLPRPGSHTDLEAGFVIRRQNTSVTGGKRDIRQLASSLVSNLARAEHPGITPRAPAADVGETWWADEAWRRSFEQDNAPLLTAVTAQVDDQAWMIGAAGGQWRKTGTPPEPGQPPDAEQELPMWRLPPRAGDCAAARTRSLWFGLVPTYSADTDQHAEPKLDDHAMYGLVCFVRQAPAAGHEHCPPKIWWSTPSEPFRLAAPSDPDGTKNHQVTIPMPDLRRLAARAGQRQGPGGARIVTPPGSQLTFDASTFLTNPRGTPPTPGEPGITCTFAFELFIIVAFFLFRLFLPIVTFAFQLWWLLALRFCFPLPAVSFTLLEDYFAQAGHTLATLPQASAGADRDKFDVIFGPGSAAKLATAPAFTATPSLAGDLVAASDPHAAAAEQAPPTENKPADPLCPGGAA